MSKLFNPKVEDFIDFIDVRRAIQFYCLYNESMEAYYHNYQHVEYMLSDLADFAYAGASDGVVFGNMLPTLATAIIFHDFNHSEGKCPDSENIERALQAYQIYSTLSNTQPDPSVIQLIRATQYPYLDLPTPKITNSKPGVTNTNIELMCKIIRDLDLLLWSHAGHPQAADQLIGLFLEVREQHPELNFEAFLERNAEFLRSTPLSTAFAKNLFIHDFEPSWASLVAQARSIVEEQFVGEEGFQ